MSAYRLFVNEDRTVLVRIWPGGTCEVCTRTTSDDIWSPPVRVREEEL